MPPPFDEQDQAEQKGGDDGGLRTQQQETANQARRQGAPDVGRPIAKAHREPHEQQGDCDVAGVLLDVASKPSERGADSEDQESGDERNSSDASPRNKPEQDRCNKSAGPGHETEAELV